MSCLADRDYGYNCHFPLMIAQWCDYRTLVRMSQVNTVWYDILASYRRRAFNHIPWTLMVEYVRGSEKSWQIHTSALIIGRVLFSPLDNCEHCSGGRWQSITLVDDQGNATTDICQIHKDGLVITSSQIGAVAWRGRGGDYLHQSINRLQRFDLGGRATSVVPISFQVATVAWSDGSDSMGDPMIQPDGHPMIQSTLIDPEMRPSVVDTRPIQRYDDVRVHIGSFPDNWFTSIGDSTISPKSPIDPEPSLVAKYRHLRQSSAPISATLGWHIQPSYWDNFFVVNCTGDVWDEEETWSEAYRPIKRRRLWRR